MADLVELFQRSADQFGTRVDSIQDDQWSAPTPCADWDVRQLVNHVTYEQLWAPPLLRGETIADVGDRYEGDVLGDDPKAAWHAAVAPSKASFAEEGALDRTVHLSYGDESCREYLTQMLTDAAVHGWDLARGIGADETIDPEAVQVLLDAWLPRQDFIAAATGMFAPPIDVPDDADPQTKLLALLGRQG